jgi:hypothetical protein
MKLLILLALVSLAFTIRLDDKNFDQGDDALANTFDNENENALAYDDEDEILAGDDDDILAMDDDEDDLA